MTSFTVGHGQAIKLGKEVDTLANWPGSHAEQFCRLLQRELPTIVRSTLEDALKKYSSNSDASTLGEDDVVAHIKAELGLLHQRVNRHLVNIDDSLLRENGSTFCLAILWRDHLLAANIGDSSMIFFDRSSGEPLRVWKRDDNHHEESDPGFEVCSYEDTLAHYPTQIREGQFLNVVQKDFDRIINNCRVVTNVYGQRHYPVYSLQSPYGLAMTNTLGNLHHAGRTFSRASVYDFSLRQLSNLTERGNFAMCFVTDGVKDVMSCSMIGNFLRQLDSALVELVKADVHELGVDLANLDRLCLDDLLYLAAGGQVRRRHAPAVDTQRAREEVSLELLGFHKVSRPDQASNLAQAELKAAIAAEQASKLSATADASARNLSPSPSLVTCAKAIVNSAILKQTCDDVTCLIVEFQPKSSTAVPKTSGALANSNQIAQSA